MFKLVYKINLFHQVSPDCSDDVIEIILHVILRGQPEWNVIEHSRVLAKRLTKQQEKDTYLLVAENTFSSGRSQLGN